MKQNGKRLYTLTVEVSREVSSEVSEVSEVNDVVKLRLVSLLRSPSQVRLPSNWGIAAEVSLAMSSNIRFRSALIRPLLQLAFLVSRIAMVLWNLSRQTRPPLETFEFKSSSEQSGT